MAQLPTPAVGANVFTRQQVAVIGQLIQAFLQEALELDDPRGLLPSTVESYDATTRYAVVTIDGDTSTTRVFNKDWPQLQPGDRVFVEFLPGGVAFVDGAIRTTDILCGCTIRSSPTLNVPQATLTDLKSLSEDYDPFEIYDPTTGKLTIPVGGDGLWSITSAINHFGGGFTRCFVEVELDGFTYRGANYVSGSAADAIDSATTGPVFLSEGDVVDLRMYHDGTGGPADFFVRVDAWKVQPGRLS